MSLEEIVEKAISGNKVMMFSKSYCPFCDKAKNALKELGVDFEVMELDKMADGGKIQDIMYNKTGARSVPRVFVQGKFVGGGDKTVAMKRSGELLKLINA